MNNGVFRPNALAAQVISHLGQARIEEIPGANRLVAAAAVAIAAILGVMLFLTFTKYTTIVATVSPRGGVFVGNAKGEGTLLDVFVAEGEVVKAGQLLMRFGDDRMLQEQTIPRMLNQSRQRQIDEAQRELTAVEAQAAIKSSALENSFESAAAQLKIAESEVELLIARERTAKSLVDQYEHMASQGFVSDATVTQKVDAWAESKIRVEQGRRTLNSISLEYRKTEWERVANKAALQESQARLRARIAELDGVYLADQVKGRWEIVAPRDGKISSINVTRGQSVRPDQAVIEFIPIDSKSTGFEIEALVPLNKIAGIQQGQEVRIRYRALPYQRFGQQIGRISSVGSSPVLAPTISATKYITLSSGEANLPCYKVMVTVSENEFSKFDGRLRSGMVADVIVPGEARPIWRWLMSGLR